MCPSKKKALWWINPVRYHSRAKGALLESTDFNANSTVMSPQVNTVHLRIDDRDFNFVNCATLG
jgi:hypothetical protein